ncbi:MAG: SH3 domain-containing protein, partial [Lewinella sp.]
TLFAQDGPTSSDKYVWAKSGLTLRAEGNLKGEKLAVIPYGATVQLTGEWGEDLSIDIIPERELDG